MGEQGAEGDLGLHASQGSAQAVVNAVAEGDVAAGVAAEVEAVRVGELGGVPVGGTDRGGRNGCGPGAHAGVRGRGCLGLRPGRGPGIRLALARLVVVLVGLDQVVQDPGEFADVAGG